VPHSNPGHKVRGSPQPRTQSPKFEAADYVPNDLVVATTHASDTTPVNGADDFLGWYSDEYRRWHYGAPAPRISTARRRFVEDLLEQIPFRQLQLMTLLALSMRLRQETLDDNRLYVARSDHSLTVIYEKASVLADDVKVLGLDMYEGSLDELAEAIRTGKQVLASPASEISRRERTAAAVDVLSDLLTEIGD
jgi:hypothetical protein